MKGFRFETSRVYLESNNPFYDLFFTLRSELPPDHSLRQVHGNRIVTTAELNNSTKPEADGLWLTPEDRGGPWALWYADCVPVALCHPSGHVVLAHCGFAGTYRHLLYALAPLWKTQGLNLSDCQAWIGPHIRTYSRKKHGDLKTIEALKTFHPSMMRDDGEEVLFDLAGELKAQLSELGLDERNIYDLDEDTVTLSHRWFSHRRGDTGRHALVAQRKER